MNERLKTLSIQYGLHLMREVTGVDPGVPPPEDVPLRAFEPLVGKSWPGPERTLTSIFSRVHLPKSPADPRRSETVYLHPAPLQMQKAVLFPRLSPPDDPEAARRSAGKEFAEAFARMKGQIREDDPRFLTGFHHLLERYAWALPNTYGEPGVSLFHQWKAVTALAFAARGDPTAETFTLIGGDIPGIQDFIYTITSRGAAKGLRGRSLFIQLLGDAVVRRLVDELGLSPANVVYAAGGNFMLLAPADAPETLKKVHDDVNRKLLATYGGEVALCLAAVPLPASAVGTARFGLISRDLWHAVAREKGRRFAAVAQAPDGWERLFAPEGRGGEKPAFCAVCQAELTPEERRDDRLLLRDVGEEEAGETAPRACSHCATFRDLAEAVGRPEQALFLSRTRPPGEGERWQELLHDLSGWWYRLDNRDRPAGREETKLLLNEPDFLQYGAHGFRFLANTTPRATEKDGEWWDQKYPDRKGQVRPGSIRSFELLAHAAAADGAAERVGVLRMDVDDLGQVMTRGLQYAGQPHRSLAATSALSAALDRFFSGYLDVLCREVTANPGMTGVPGHPDEDRVYVIYAGGDDLFIVGAWHVLPLLAGRIRDAFEEYVGRNPFLHISAGITLEGRRFPLYQAARRAHDALEEGAKRRRYTQDGLELEKNGIHFLGQTLGWDEFAEVRQQVERLVRLVREHDVPRGLLQSLQAIFHRFQQDHQNAQRRGLRGQQVYYGPWMWRQAYYLDRFARGKPEEVRREIGEIQRWTLSHRILYLGLAARWAEFLTRKEEER